MTAVALVLIWFLTVLVLASLLKANQCWSTIKVGVLWLSRLQQVFCPVAFISQFTVTAGRHAGTHDSKKHSTANWGVLGLTTMSP